MTVPAETPAAVDEKAWPSLTAAWWVAVLLMLANTLAFVDRQALALLVEPIKQDLGINDTAISLLYGLSFTLFYVIVGIPVARLADRSNRRNIIAASILIWSVCTALCGFARSFPALFLARIGVGAGEGGLTPSAYSILSDYFPKHRLAAALGFYQMGLYVGGASALLIGGLISTVIPPLDTVALPLLGAVRGWQVVFILLGLPGIVLTLLMFTIREPVRQGAPSAQETTSVGAFGAHFARRRMAYGGIMLAFALMILVGNGTAVWIPALLERKFGWSTAQIGHSYGLIVFVCGTSGALIGGQIAARLSARRGEIANLQTALVGFLALIPITIAFPLVGSVELTLILIGAMNFFAGFNFGGGLAALQNITPNRMRAMMSAVYMLTINIIGAAFGPTAVALVTDYGFKDPQALPQALAIVAAVASPLATLVLLAGMRDYRKVRGLEADAEG